jgi:hypothetical protein
MPLPSNMPPRYQADAVALMNDIENAQNWRDLVRTFAKLARLPANETHLLGIAITLTLLAPGPCERPLLVPAQSNRVRVLGAGSRSMHIVVYGSNLRLKIAYRCETMSC